MSRKWINTLLTTAVFSILLSSCEDLLTDPDGGNMRERLVDTWKVDETESPRKSSKDIYWVEISKHPYDSNRVIIYNFYNVDADAEAVVNGYTLSLPAQTLEGGYEVSGSGQIQGSRANEIIWTYTVDDGSGVAASVSAVYTRLTF
jgi:hypothetical protein